MLIEKAVYWALSEIFQTFLIWNRRSQMVLLIRFFFEIVTKEPGKIQLISGSDSYTPPIKDGSTKKGSLKK